jgi:hypothetical protein
MTATSSLPVGEGPRLLLTVPDAAAALSISRSKLYELLTVADYLAQWLEAHATTVSQRPSADTATTSTTTSCPESGVCGFRLCGQR